MLRRAPALAACRPWSFPLRPTHASPLVRLHVFGHAGHLYHCSSWPWLLALSHKMHRHTAVATIAALKILPSEHLQPTVTTVVCIVLQDVERRCSLQPHACGPCSTTPMSPDCGTRHTQWMLLARMLGLGSCSGHGHTRWQLPRRATCTKTMVSYRSSMQPDAPDGVVMLRCCALRWCCHAGFAQ